MELNALDNLAWPHVFQQTSMNRAAHSAMADDEQVPWLIGVDGRVRGAIKPFPGMTYYGFAPYRYAASFTIVNYASLTLNINGYNFGSIAASGGSVNAFATAVASSISLAFPFWSETSAVGGTVTVRWSCGYGYNGAFTLAAGGSALAAPVNTTLSPEYSGQASTSMDALFCKYAAIRLASGSLLRGYVVQNSAGDIRYYYKYGVGGEAFSDFVTIATSKSDYKIGVTTNGRMLYVVGRNSSGSSFAKVAVGTGTTAAGTLVSVYDMGPRGATTTIGAMVRSTGGASGGQLRLGRYSFVYRYYDSVRYRRSPISAELDTVYLDGEYGVHNNNNHSGDDPFLPYTNTYGAYDYIEFYSSISSRDGDQQAGQPYFYRGRKAITDDVWEWKFAADLGTTADDNLNDDALTYISTQVGSIYDPLNDVVNTSVPGLEDIIFFNGTNFGIEPVNEYLDLRWTPLQTIEPENFPALNYKRTSIPANGTARFITAGDYLWLLGDGESYRIQKRGNAMAISRMLEGISFVGSQASVAVGGTIFAVSTQGVLAINSETGDYQQIASCDQVIQTRWAKNLIDANAYSNTIMLAFDAYLGCVTIFNRLAGEAVLLWLTTNRVTMMVDMWWDNLFDGLVPNRTENVRRTFVLSEQPDASSIGGLYVGGLYGGQFLHYSQYQTSTPNMLGLTVGASGDVTTSLVKTPSAVLLDTNSTILEFASSSLPNLVNRNRVTGGVIYDMTPDDPVGYKIVYSNQSGSTLQIWIEGDHTDEFTTSTVFSICPIVTAALLAPMIGAEPNDQLWRRVTNGMATGLSASSDITTGATDGLLTYGLTRNSNVGDDTVLDAVAADPMLVAARSLPFTPSWTVAAAKGVTLNNTAPAQTYAPLIGDGCVLHPSFKFVRSGQWISVIGLTVFGRINPNRGVETVT